MGKWIIYKGKKVEVVKLIFGFFVEEKVGGNWGYIKVYIGNYLIGYSKTFTTRVAYRKTDEIE